jgi:hypothetical protein
VVDVEAVRSSAAVPTASPAVNLLHQQQHHSHSHNHNQHLQQQQQQQQQQQLHHQHHLSLPISGLISSHPILAGAPSSPPSTPLHYLVHPNHASSQSSDPNASSVAAASVVVSGGSVATSNKKANDDDEDDGVPSPSNTHSPPDKDKIIYHSLTSADLKRRHEPTEDDRQRKRQRRYVQQTNKQTLVSDFNWLLWFALLWFALVWLIGSTNSLQQNRHSAALSRSRKKDYLQQIEKELNELREEHAQLNEQLKQRTLRVRELEAQLGISTSANELEDVMDKDKDKVADDYAK